MFKVIGHEFGKEWDFGYTQSKKGWLKRNNGWNPQAVTFIKVTKEDRKESRKFMAWIASANK